MENNVFNIDDYLPNATMPNNAPQTQAPFNIDDYLGVQARDVTGFGEKQAVDFASQLAKFSNADPMKQFEAYEQYRNQYKDHLTGKGYSDTQITQALSEFDEKADPRNQSNWADYFTDFGKSIMAGTGNMFADILAAVPERASVVGMFADAGEKVLRDGARAWEESKSDRFKIQAALGDRAEKEALANGAGELEGLWANLKENPMQVPHLIAGQVPQLALGGLGKIPAGIAFMMGGAGRVRNDIEEAYDKTFKENPAQLLQLPEIQQRMKQGMTFEQAVNEAKTDITDHWTNILAGAVIGGSESFSPFNKIGQGVNRGVARTVGKEVGQEMFQEGGEQLNSNLAVGKIDGETQPFDNVLRNAALGGIAGLGMALPSAVDAHINRNKQAEDDKLIDELAQAVGSSGNVAENAAATPAPVNEKALEAVLNQANLTPENYDALFDDLKQDIEDGLIAQRASENSAYGKLAQAYLQTAGASVGNESQGAASSTPSTPSTPSALPAAKNPQELVEGKDYVMVSTDTVNMDKVREITDQNILTTNQKEIEQQAKNELNPEEYRLAVDILKKRQADHYDDNGNLKAAFQAQKTDTEQAKNVDEKRYSLNESANSDFAQAVDAVAAGKRAQQAVISIGTTPDVLKMLGLPDANVVIHAQTLHKVMQDKHAVAPDVLKRVPAQINNPVAVMKSSTTDNGYVVLTELTENGKPLIAALHLKQAANGLELINIASVYGRSRSQIQNGLNNDLLYWNKEKGAKFLNNFALQLRSSSSETSPVGKHIKTESDLSQYQNSSVQSFNKASHKANQLPKAERKALVGAKDTLDIGENNYQPFQYEVVEAAELSPTQQKADNQFRDRDRSASQLQVNKIARNLDPRKLGESPTMEMGAPLLAQDGQTIIAGNGRSMALHQAYQEGNADGYKQYLQNNAAKFGLNVDDLSTMQQPVLVRRLKTAVDIQQAAIHSNEQGGMRMSNLEQAKVDAGRLPNMAGFELGENGEINTAGNREFISRFIQNQPEALRNELLDSKGNLSQTGVQRLRNAILFNAYGDTDILSRAVESTDQGARNIINALIRVAPKVAQVKQDIASGNLNDVDISADIVAAVEKYHQLKSQNRDVGEYLQQQDFVGELAPEAKAVLRIFDENSRSAKRIADVLNSYYQSAEVQGNTAQSSMFGDETFDKAGTLEQAKNADLEKRYSLNENADSAFAKAVDADLSENIYYSRTKSTLSNAQIINIASGKLKRFGKAILENKYIPSQPIDLGNTPKALVDLGVPQLPMVLNPKKIAQIVRNENKQRDHNLNPDLLAQVPAQLQNPLAIFNSATEKHAFVAVMELKDSENRPIIAAVHINKKQGFNFVNRVASIYGRNNANKAFKNWAEQGLLRWVNPQKSQSVLTSFGLQSPTEKLQTGYGEILSQSTEQHNIPAEANSPIIEQARQMLQKVLGQHADKVRLVTRREVGAEAGVEGYFHNGEAVVVVDNIHADQVFSQAERLAWVAWHELGHAGVNVRLADRYQRIMAHARTHPVVDGIARRVEKSYSANQHTISPERATEEALVEIFVASKTGDWAKLEQDYGVKIHRSWKSGERDVRQFLEKILTYLRRAIGSVMGKNLQQATSGEILAILRQVDNGVANFASKPTADNDARYSLNENANSDFAQAVDAVAAGKTPVRQYIPMGKTPDVLKMLGVVDTKVSVSRDVLNKVMGGKHNIAPDALKQLPAQINNPVAVMKSAPQATQQGYVVLTELVEENNGKQEPVVSALHLKRVNSGLEVINIASAYGKSRRGLQNMLNHDLLYWHKTKGSHFLDAFGLQLPAKVASSDVSQSVGNIKTESDLSQYQNGEKRFSRRPKSESLAKLRDAETIKISGKEIEASSDIRQYRRNALEYGKTLRGAYVNKDTGREISLGRNGITEVLHHDVSNPEHLQSVAAIPQIIENAIYVDTLKNEEANKNGDIQEYDYYVAGLNIGGKDYTVKAVVGTSEKNGERYYDHKLTPMKKGELLSLSYRLSSAGLSENRSPNQGELLSLSYRVSNAGLSENRSPAIDDKRLLQILQDENPTASTSPDSPTPESEVRYSRRQSVEDLANTGQAREDSSSLFQEMVNRDVDALKKRFDGAMAQLDEALADSWRPVSDWIDQLPAVNEPLKALLKGRMYRAKNLRNVARSNIEQRHMKPIIAMLGRFADKHNISPLTAKRIVGFYGSLRYSIIKNQALLERERLAMEDAKAALDAAQAQGNLSADEMDKLDADYRRAERQYRYRKHDVELAHGSTAEFKVGTAGGWSIPEAQVLMAKFEQQLPKKEMEIVLARLSKLQDDLLNLDELSGRYTPAQLAEYRADKFYVPLTGDPNMEDVDSFIGGSGSRSLNIARDKALKGRKLSEAEDAFDAVWKAVGKSTTFYGWQPFKQTLKDVFDARSSELQAGGLSEKSANEQASAELGIEIKLATAFTRPSDNVLVHKELGKYYTITLPNGMVQRLKDDTLENASVWIKPISTPTRWMAYGVTQLTVDFAPKNMIRDVWDKSDMIRDKTIFDQHGKPLSQKEKNRIGREVWLNMANPKQDIWKATNRFARGAEFDLNNPTEQLMAEFVKYGGLSSFTQHIAQTESDLVKQIKQSGSRSAAMVEQLAGYVQAYNGTFDYVSSLATYKALRDHHIDPEQAASLVLDLANFGKTGAKMRNAKGLFMFLQPKMMGAAALLRSLNTRSGQKRFVAQLVVFGMFYEALRMGFSALFDDDESGNKLDTLGDITGFIPIPIPWADKESERKYWKLHLGFGSAQLAWNMVINTSRAAHGSISFTDAATNIATNWGKVFAPVSPSEISASKDPVAKAVMTLTPSLFQPIMQLGFNRNAFGSPIHTTFENNRAVKAEQGRMNTAAEWSNLAEWIYDATGGAVDAYPESYKHLVEGYALPLGSVREALNIFIENPNRAKLGKTERPVTLRAIVGDTNPFVVQRDYFQAIDEAQTTHKAYERFKEQGKLAGWLTPEKQAEVQFYQRADKQERLLRREKAKQTKALNERKLSQEAYDNWIKHYYTPKADRVQRRFVHEWRKMKGLDTTPSQ